MRLTLFLSSLCSLASLTALTYHVCVAQPVSRAPSPPPPKEHDKAQDKTQDKTQGKTQQAGAEGLIERGEISREELARHLARGPQPLVASVRVAPARAKGQFIGFKLVMIAPGSPAERAGLREGDVLTHINDMSIGRPEQVMAVWGALEGAQELKVGFKRGSKALVYRWAVR